MTGLDHIALKLLEDAEQKMRGHFVGLSFWSDGVPVSWDRKESTQCFTWAPPWLGAKDTSPTEGPTDCSPQALLLSTDHGFCTQHLWLVTEADVAGNFP